MSPPTACRATLLTPSRISQASTALPTSFSARGFGLRSPTDNSLAITATVKTADGATISGRVTQVSDFRITLVDGDGQTHVIDRVPGVDVVMKDPLAPHQAMVMTLKNDDMHNVTAYLETLK